ncbi:hypothetical protein EDD16DRAFT_1529186 [Pisolithus croceorrhizus]|nr:hypothetical protein EDD16DRAFT_1529186 [Pisolithus croceorrhizus]
MYQISHLQSFVKCAMCCALSNPTSVGVYKVVMLCSCCSLQIHALKSVMADLVTNSAVYMLTIARGGGGSQNLDQGDSEYQGHPNDALELPNHPQGMFTVRLPGTADQQSMTLDSKGHVGSQITAEAPQQISDKIGPVMLHSKTKAIQS